MNVSHSGQPGVFAIALTLTLAAALALWGCGGAADAPTGGSGENATTSTSSTAGDAPSSTSPGGGGQAFDFPSGEDELVLRVEQEGGFLPAEVALRVPLFSLYGGGRIFQPAPTIAIFPPPALRGYQVAEINREAIERILRGAEEAGLLEQRDYGTLPVADAPNTTFIFHLGGEETRTSIYALGFEPPLGDGVQEGLTPEQRKAREDAQQYLQSLMSVSAHEGEELAWESYEPSEVAAYVREADPAAYEGAEVQPNRLEWPLGDLAGVGEETAPGLRRLVVSGEELTQLRPLLQEASAITLWESGSEFYQIAFRPLLPDENE